MILSSFFTATVHELINFLKENKDFFELDKTAREAKLKELDLFSSLKTYLLDLDIDTFLSDLKVAVSFLLNPEQVNPSNNSLLKACAEFLATDFASDLDLIDAKFANQSQKSKQEFVDDLIQIEGQVGSSLKALLLSFSHQEIYENVNDLLKVVLNTAYVIIQTPVEINSKMKKDIRRKISTDLKQVCMPIFQVNKAIIGGMRIFIDGEVQDQSWLARINFITQIKN